MPHTPIILAATQTLIDHVEELTALDQAIGDGDHGLNMKRGATAIQARLPEWQGRSLNDTLKAMGMTCMSTIGGSSGPVFGTLLVTLAKELPPDPGPADLSRALQQGLAALTRLGKAEVGQKTLLDVLDPLQRLLAQPAPATSTPDSGKASGASGAGGAGGAAGAAGAGSAALLARARQCAFDAADATARMDAIKGRASFLGERALGHVDPGSRSMALIVAAICDSLSQTDSQTDTARS